MNINWNMTLRESGGLILQPTRSNSGTKFSLLSFILQDTERGMALTLVCSQIWPVSFLFLFLTPFSWIHLKSVIKAVSICLLILFCINSGLGQGASTAYEKSGMLQFQ